MERFVCIHGHFYQPPRENPWLEAIESQDSAHPYHDWNERIDAECYGPNASARILNSAGFITQIVSNYSRISFDFGPTLLSWLEEQSPTTYQAILEADIESQRLYSGHGSAMAQAYNHMILPLANRRDKITQIIWGIRDFTHRFHRPPEGLWLPETAVDLESLEIAVDQGIRFTVLAPHQARRVRKIGGRNWKDVSGQGIDPKLTYSVRLPSGRDIAVFFYDGPISRGIAFEGILRNGDDFVNRLLSGLDGSRSGPQLMHVATDGETYGHHHRFGDMALAFGLKEFTERKDVQLTNYGDYLERFPPSMEAEIVENTSWSCAHGVERWRSDCGCNTGGQPGWNQKWRAPLREALDWLRDILTPRFDQMAQLLFSNPWNARNDYIQVVLDRSDDSIASFLSDNAVRTLNERETITALKLMEMQRHAMLMYTSCGWFFNDISGIETVQVIQYAARVIQLAQELTGDSYESRFVSILEQARSNIRDHRDGRHVYESFVKPAIVGLPAVAAHVAISALFQDPKSSDLIGCYKVEEEEFNRLKAGRSRLALGRVRIASSVTRESSRYEFGAVHLGDHNITCAVHDMTFDDKTPPLHEGLRESFEGGDFPQVLRLLDSHPTAKNFNLRSLFRDEQRRLITLVLMASLAEAETVYKTVYEDHAPLMRFVTELRLPAPRAFLTAAEFVLNADILRQLRAKDPDFTAIEARLDEAKRVGVAVNKTDLGYTLVRTLNQMLEELFESPVDLPLLEKAAAAANLAHTLEVQIDLREAQNYCYEMRQWFYPDVLKRSDSGDTGAKWWVERFRGLAKALKIQVD